MTENLRYRRTLTKSGSSLILGFICCFLSTPVLAQFYNGLQNDFGKNRVQYEERLWTVYQFDKFDTYFYRGGKDLAVYTAKSGIKYLDELEKLFDYKLDGRIKFVIYNKLTDLRQSNIGYYPGEEENTGGVTRIVGSKVFIFFDGNHHHLEKEIKRGIASILVNQMMYGGDIKDMVKNATLLTLPEWYINGLVSYLSEEWSVEIDNRVKDGILSGRYKKFNRLTGKEALYAGHSIWRYVAETYGESVLANVLYMAKITRNVDSGFLFVIGSSLKSIVESWENYYLKMYSASADTRNEPAGQSLLKRNRSKRIYDRLKISPDGRYAAYTTNEIGLYRLMVYDLQTGKRKKIFKRGYRTIEHETDLSYPLLAWHPSGKFMTVMTEKKGKVMVGTYTPEMKKYSEKQLFNFEKILSFDYSHDGKQWVFSAINNGQSDIFVYHIASNTYQQITNDIYDDLDPVFTEKTGNIVFSSNRLSDTLKAKADSVFLLPDYYDLFLYEYKKDSKILRRITNTPLTNERQPQEYEPGYISYLSDKNGIRNRFLAHLDSTISHIDTVTHYRYVTRSYPVTNYSRNIVHHNVVPAANKYAEIVYRDGHHYLYVNDLFSKEEGKIELENTRYKKALYLENSMSADDAPEGGEDRTTLIKLPTPEEQMADTLIDIDNYEFEDEKEEKVIIEHDDEDGEVSEGQKKQRSDEPEITTLPPQRNYETAFYPNYLVNQLDNTYLNPTYQPFNGGSEVAFNPGLSGLFKLGIIDLLEDYRISGGLRLSFSEFSGNEYYVQYDDFRRRLDRTISFYRSGTINVAGFSLIRHHIHELKYKVRWPFSERLAVQGTVNARSDRRVFLSSDFNNLVEPNLYDHYGGARAELIFDNTIRRGLNLYNGLRYKLFAEYYKEVNGTKRELVVLGADFRHYQKVHRDLIWANRFAISTAFGTNKLIYYLGGVDNWLAPKFNRNIQIDFTQNYGFQALATNMRGFQQNIRNGNSFAVINSEMRLPVFKYFSSRPLKSDFLANFQVIAFGDVGTAWTGPNPYSEENSLNKETIQQGPITATVFKQIEPIVGGYGFGLRSRIWGYFVRADWAWGIEDGIRQPAIFYISLSLDF